MKRRRKENKQKVEPVILVVLIIGAIIGVIVGCTLELYETTTVVGRIIFCVYSAFMGSLFTLFFLYYVLEAIIETQNYIEERRVKKEERRVKKEGRGFID